MEPQPKYKTKTQPRDSFIEHGKLPPQCTDLEEAVLGSLMLEREAIHQVIGLLITDCFYKESHQVIFEAIKTLYDSNKPVDILTVTAQLRSNGKLELAGGPFYITQLTSRIASSANIEQHVSTIVEKYLARELIKVSTETIRSAFEDETDIFDLLGKSDSAIARVNDYTAKGGSFEHVSELTENSVQQARQREIQRKDGKTSGITTGLKYLNVLTGGWKNSELIIIAARPGMGKTSLILHHAIEAAKSGKSVCIYSLEMSKERLTDNLMLSLCDVDKDRFKNGWMSNEEWAMLLQAKTDLNNLKIFIDPNPSVSLRYIKSNSRIMHRNGKCDLIMIDYLQLADVATDERNRNREQEISQASRMTKIIAKQLNVPVILLSQLNREVEKRPDKKPQLSDLRESGAIEQDADIVMFIWRPEYYGFKEDDRGNSVKGVGKYILAKNRDGACDEVKFRYNESMTHITNYTEEYQINTPLTF